MRRDFQFLKLLILCSLVFLLLPRMTCAQDGAEGQFSAEDLEGFLGSFMPKEMKALHVPGAIVVIVSNGEILLEKGYGYANLEDQTHIKPNRTLFRMGSISKLFTTVAVLQLAEQGKLHLNDEVNQYLKTFKVNSPFPEPVRVFHLLTHTGGFDERNIESAALKESQIEPLGAYLARRMPPVVRQPGDLISYSNHGFTLAGYLVELVSGMPFPAYIKQHILKPLGMNRSSFDPDKELKEDLATGYTYEKGDQQPAPFDYFNDGPADSLISTGSDMARFMIANLQSGQFNNARILQPQTMEDMQKLHFTHHPGMPGWCYGFWEMYRNNLRGIVHDGCVYGFTSRVYLAPEKNFGFFIGTNIDVTNRGDLTNVVTARLLDYCFPAVRRNPRPELTPDFASRAHSYEGYYRHVCYASKTMEKLGLLMGFAPEIYVRLNPDNTLSIESREYVEVKPLFFEHTNGRSYASFRENQAHQITHLFVETDAFEKIPWYDTNRFQLSLAGSCLAIFLSAILAWLVKALRRKTADSATGLYRIAGLVSALHILFVVIVYVTFARKRLFELSYGIPPVLKAALILPLISIVLTAILIVWLYRAWKQRGATLLARTYFTLTGAAAVTFLWVLEYWNLIGFRY